MTERKRVSLADNIACGIVAYVIMFGLYFLFGGKPDGGWRFYCALALACWLHGEFVRSHPGTVYSK